ncbi:glycoside hydrolase family 15 protein [Streptomyces hirsutus]
MNRAGDNPLWGDVAVRLDLHVAGRVEDYALIEDIQTAALVCRDGTVDWLCLPRFDSHAIFAGLLGAEEHGFWRIGPAHAPDAHPPAATRRGCRGDSLILQSEVGHRPRHGPGDRFHASARRCAAALRIVEGVGPRADALGAPDAFLLRPGGAVGAQARGTHGRRPVAGPDSVWLDTSAETYGQSLTTYSDFTVAPGDRIAFTLSWQPSHKEPPPLPELEQSLEATEDFWREWVEHCSYHGPYREAVIRSLITLKALTYAPTGGIVAAPTTSLPEDIGGVRNWDYRCTWLRDAAIALSSLLRTGYREEARAWREWLLRAVAGDPENLQIMYGIAGERELGEAESGLAARLRELRPGPGGQRRGAPAPAGCVRRSRPRPCTWPT